MKTKTKAAILTAIIVLFVICTWLTGCSTVHKVFNKNKSVVDSSYLHSVIADSLTTIDSSSFHKENTTVLTKSDSSKTNEETTITERTTIKEFNDSGKVKKETVIDTKTEIKKGGVSGSITVFENSSKIDSNELKKAAQISKEEVGSGHVYKKERETLSEVTKKKSFQFLWWLLLLIAAYLIYRNWPKIKAFVIHLITGL